MLGLCKIYRRFIEGFSKKAKTLYKLTEQDQKWEFGAPPQKAFEGLIYKLTHTLMQLHYKAKKPVIVETDASKYGTAGIMSQPGEDNMLRPIVIRSKSMSKSECNSDVHDKELLAII